jgi:1-acyl-sn-glycerol-3-phosphate acyltransferase
VRFLYDAVASGMWAYTHAAFRVRVLTPKRFRLHPGTLMLSTHRGETDVPLVCPPLFFGARLWWHRSERMSFAARDDMFLRGFFAGFPPDLSPRARRLLYRIGVARWLPVVDVHPIRSASTARLGEALSARPRSRLADLLPAETAESFRERAAATGLAEPGEAADVLRGEYADLLWRPITRADLVDGALDDVWAVRAARAAADFRALVDLIKAGTSLLVFPEGRPSPDGEIGPLQRGASALLRRARPKQILPIGIAYDPLVSGRTLAFVAIGPFVAPPVEDVEEEVLRLLKQRTPFTCGQFVAARLLARADPKAADLAVEVAEARAAGRPVDAELLGEGSLRRRLDEALRAAARHESELPFLAREYESARS